MRGNEGSGGGHQEMDETYKDERRAGDVRRSGSEVCRYGVSMINAVMISEWSSEMTSINCSLTPPCILMQTRIKPLWLQHYLHLASI